MTDTPTTATDIVRLLAARHSEDVFVPECKTGASWTAVKCPRLDAWAMKRSWARPATYGYEIKIARGDFLQDDKWPDYLGYCHYFSFVAPAGLIQPEEVPEGCGLICVSSTGTKLYTKRKAPRREVQVPDTLYRYVLMSRAKIVSGTLPIEDGDAREYWGGWIKRQKIDQEFGWRVGRGIRRRVAEEIDSVRRENKALSDRMAGYDRLRAQLAALGVNPDGSGSWWEQEAGKAASRALACVPPNLRDGLASARRGIEMLIAALDKMEAAHD